MQTGVSLSEQGFTVVGPGLCDWLLSFARLESEVESERIEAARDKHVR